MNNVKEGDWVEVKYDEIIYIGRVVGDGMNSKKVKLALEHHKSLKGIKTPLITLWYTNAKSSLLPSKLEDHSSGSTEHEQSCIL